MNDVAVVKRLGEKLAEKFAIETARDMHEMGFDDPDDFAQWKLLERLRSMTLDVRKLGDQTLARPNVFDSDF